MDIRCFWLEETGAVKRSLRRYSRRSSWGDRQVAQYDPQCAGYGYHNAHVRIEDDVAPTNQMIDLTPSRSAESFVNDPRWPTKCEHCDYVFEPTDEWQVFVERIYRRNDNRNLTTLRDAPAGAMWDAWWLDHEGQTARPTDGIRLMVKTPDGEWYVDGKSSNGPGWTRTGDPKADPPTVTALPSILMHAYHGWLRNGKLVPA